MGITTAIYTNNGLSSGVGFAIPINIAKNVIPQILDYHRVLRPELGVEVTPAGEVGLRVLKVAKGSPADKAGLSGAKIVLYDIGAGLVVKPDLSVADIILEADGVQTNTVDGLMSYIESKKPNQVVTLTVIRNGRAVKIPVKFSIWRCVRLGQPTICRCKKVCYQGPQVRRESRKLSRILVIEDDLSISELVKINLELLGHQVITAPDGIKGLAMATQNRPDLIVLDVMMPDLDGFTVCQRLRQNRETNPIPVLMLTALSTTKDKVAGFDVERRRLSGQAFRYSRTSSSCSRSLRRAGTLPHSSSLPEILTAGEITLIPENLQAKVGSRIEKLTLGLSLKFCTA